MFIVIMIILILLGIGTFSVSNARYETNTAANMRARNVAAGLADFGGYATIAVVQTDPNSYRAALNASASTCQSNGAAIAGVTLPCTKVDLQTVETTWSIPGQVIVAASATSPGSLGHLVPTTANPLGGPYGGFLVELTDPRDLITPVPGFPIGTVKFSDITLNAWGIFWFDDNANGQVDLPNEARSATYAQSKGHVIAGPFIGG